MAISLISLDEIRLLGRGSRVMTSYLSSLNLNQQKRRFLLVDFPTLHFFGCLLFIPRSYSSVFFSFFFIIRFPLIATDFGNRISVANSSQGNAAWVADLAALLPNSSEFFVLFFPLDSSLFLLSGLLLVAHFLPPFFLRRIFISVIVLNEGPKSRCHVATFGLFVLLGIYWVFVPARVSGTLLRKEKDLFFLFP